VLTTDTCSTQTNSSSFASIVLPQIFSTPPNEEEIPLEVIAINNKYRPRVAADISFLA